MIESMPAIILCLFRFVRLLGSGHQAVAVENLALRLQLAAFKKKRTRPVLTRWDRLFWVGLSRAVGETPWYSFSRILSFANNSSGHSSRRDPFITMVEAAEFRDFEDYAVLHYLTLNRALFVQRQMRPRSVVVAK